MTLYMGGRPIDTHELYVAGDFTEDEVDRHNNLAIAVIQEKRNVCKRCGASDDEVNSTCRARKS